MIWTHPWPLILKHLSCNAILKGLLSVRPVKAKVVLPYGLWSCQVAQHQQTFTLLYIFAKSRCCVNALITCNPVHVCSFTYACSTPPPHPQPRLSSASAVREWANRLQKSLSWGRSTLCHSRVHAQLEESVRLIFSKASLACLDWVILAFGWHAPFSRSAETRCLSLVCGCGCSGEDWFFISLQLVLHLHPAVD